MEKIDFGYEYEEPEEYGKMEPPETKKRYPCLYVNDVKQSDGIDVGDEFVAMVQMKKQSASVHENDEGKRYSCEYEVQWMKPKMPMKARSIEEAFDMLED